MLVGQRQPVTVLHPGEFGMLMRLVSQLLRWQMKTVIFFRVPD